MDHSLAKPSRSTDPPLARAGMAIADICERYFPDAFIFALAGVILVFGAGLALGEHPVKLISEFGNGFWVLLSFTMQMALVIIGGFVVASSPPCARLIEKLASFPQNASRRRGVRRVLFHDHFDGVVGALVDFHRAAGA